MRHTKLSIPLIAGLLSTQACQTSQDRSGSNYFVVGEVKRQPTTVFLPELGEQELKDSFPEGKTCIYHLYELSLAPNGKPESVVALRTSSTVFQEYSELAAQHFRYAESPEAEVARVGFVIKKDGSTDIIYIDPTINIPEADPALYRDQDQLQPIYRASPVYPRRAMERGIEGRVIVEFLINEDGTVSEAKVVDSIPNGVFDKETLAAIRRWKYEAQDQAMKNSVNISFKILRENSANCQF